MDQIGERKADRKKSRGKPRRRTRQKICRPASTEHSAGRATAEGSASVCAFAVLNQYEADQGHRDQYVYND